MVYNKADKFSVSDLTECVNLTIDFIYIKLELCVFSCHSSSDMKLTSCGRNPAFLKLFHFQHISLFVPTCVYRALIITFRFLTQVLDKNNNVMTEQQLHQ